MDRRSFIKASAVSGMGLGYSGLVSNGLAVNPARTYSRPSDLRITDIRGCVLATHFPNPIIKIYTNQDIVGLGEVRDAGWLASALMMKPHLVGKDPLEIEQILASIRHLSGHGRLGGGYSAIDIALMDIAGKAMGWPCWKLLNMGEKYREEVPIYASTGAVQNTPRYREFMQQRVEKEYQHYKMNVSSLDNVDGGREGGVPTQKGLEVWGQQVLDVRDVIGYDVSLGAQSFGYQTAASGIELGQFMADGQYGLAYIEEVIDFRRANAVNLNRQITDRSPTPTQAGENIFGLDSFAPYIMAGAFDIIHPDMLTSGGMIGTKKIAELAHRHGIPMMLHAAPSPVAQIAMVHCAAVMESFIALEYQFRWPQMPWWEKLVSGIEKPLIQEGGVIPVPEGPGLGLEFNDEVAEKYLMEPEYLPFDPGLFDPTPQFDEPMLMLEAKEKGLIDYDRDNSYSLWHIDENLEYGYKRRGS